MIGFHANCTTLPFSGPVKIAKVLLVVGLALLPMSAAGAEDIRIGTWNLEWLFDHVDNDDSSSIGPDFAAPSEEEYLSRVSGFADAIAELDPHVLALQEIENAKVVGDIAQTLKEEHGKEYVVAFVQGQDTHTGQDVTFLVKSGIEFEAERFVFDRPGEPEFKDLSKHLRLTATIGGQPITIVALHLITKAPDRMRQARTLREWITPLVGEPLIVLGDFNIGLRFAATTPTSDIGVIRGLHTEGADDDLFDAHASLSAEDRKTHVGGKELDRVLLSPALTDGTGLDFASIANRSDLSIRGETDESAGVNYDLDEEEQDLSDHFPLIVTLAVQPEVPLLAHRATAGDAGPPLPPPSSEVEIATRQLVVEGKLSPSSRPGWIAVEERTGEKVIIRLDAIEAIRTKSLPQMEALGADAVPSARYVVYVHGICAHAPNYSEPWWNALQRHAPGLAHLSRREVLWSDLVNPLTPSVAPLVSDPATHEREESQRSELRKEITDLLQDRAEELRADLPAPAGADAPVAPAGASLIESRCIDDFTLYMVRPSVREAVLSRFRNVVQPLLEEGAEVHVVGHSWGTVVAYEGMREFDSRAGEFSGRVANFFTVGSALSIAPVQRRLRPEFRDGRRPALARKWINLDARFDIVGGRLASRGFGVDHEFLNLTPVGCRSFLPSASCAHSSYFHTDNYYTNRDIFGWFIQNP
jgi:endonuclease/exonuclease/phosphatase family metal-dependent hydrolase